MGDWKSHVTELLCPLSSGPYSAKRRLSRCLGSTWRIVLKPRWGMAGGQQRRGCAKLQALWFRIYAKRKLKRSGKQRQKYPMLFFFNGNSVSWLYYLYFLNPSSSGLAGLERAIISCRVNHSKQNDFCISLTAFLSVMGRNKLSHRTNFLTSVSCSLCYCHESLVNVV